MFHNSKFQIPKSKIFKEVLMKKNIVIAIILLVFSAIPSYAADQSASAAQGLPSAVIKDNKYEFKPVMEGTQVVHEFIVENAGTAPLQIERIQTGCGCTTADFTRAIPPGGKGNVTIKANTNGYGGSVFNRHISVYTNDPKNPAMSLFMTGPVEKFADITPPTAVLRGNADKSIETRVSVKPDTKHPFKIVESHMEKSLEGKIEYSLITLENGYVLQIKNSLHTAGQYFGRIILKTDNPDKPEIPITVTGRIG